MLALILLYRHDLHIVGAAWAIMALGDGTASVTGGALRGPALPWNREKTWSGFLGFIVAGTAGAYVLTRWVAPAVAPDVALRICAATALVGAIVESAPIRLDDNATVPLVAGAFMFCLYFVERSALDSNLPFLGRRIVLAAAVNLALAVLALGLKMVNRSGAVCGFLLGVAVYLGYGYKSFLMMFAFFAIGSVATRFGYARKAARGVAEKRGGARSWREAAGELTGGRVLFPPGHHHASRRRVSDGVDRGVCGSHRRHRFQRDRPMDFRPRLSDHDVQAGSCRRRWRRLRGRQHCGRAGFRAGRGARFRYGLVWERRRRHCSCRRCGWEPA